MDTGDDAVLITVCNRRDKTQKSRTSADTESENESNRKKVMTSRASARSQWYQKKTPIVIADVSERPVLGTKLSVKDSAKKVRPGFKIKFASPAEQAKAQKELTSSHTMKLRGHRSDQRYPRQYWCRPDQGGPNK